jgi:hypothetical protein
MLRLGRGRLSRRFCCIFLCLYKDLVWCRVPRRKEGDTSSIDGFAYYAVDFGVCFVCVFGEEGVEVCHFRVTEEKSSSGLGDEELLKSEIVSGKECQTN